MPSQSSPVQNQTVPVAFPAGKQYGFYFDQGRCHACTTCMLACQEWNGLPYGPPGRWMRVMHWESGVWPTPRAYALAVPCYHCENPVCVDAANGALYKEPKYGAVLLDPAKAKNNPDLRSANQACPYGVIMFDSDDPYNSTAGKCTMCIDRLEQGLAPMCVLTCDTRAFEFGPLEELQAKFGTLKKLEGMPDPSIAQPAAIFKAHLPRKQIVPYDANKAIALWQKRGPNAGPNAPPVFQNAADVTDPNTALLLKTKPVFHYKNNAELIFWTTVDE
jgi:anaerobic dimethyl sulfoxide reductase subunit B (iron-sulfur subunit)